MSIFFENNQRDEQEKDDWISDKRVSKTGKIKTNARISYRPSRSDIIKMLHDRPFRHFVDVDGRIYGFIQDMDNPVLKNLIERGLVDVNPESPMKLMFVFLPHNAKGGFNTKEQRGRFRERIPRDELLELPEIANQYQLYNYTNTEEPVFDVEILFYPEHLDRNVKIALLVCNIQDI